jgi:DMSO/TMAO reductase YedYZ molybdopterin-dependent catalytic subunit
VKLVTIEEKPFNAETPLAEMAREITPTGNFFVRSHFDLPRLDAAGHRLTVEGAVESPRPWTLAEIHALPRHSIAATLECAGNGRTRLEPPVPGVRWGFGAAATASFSGTSLHHLLDGCAIRKGAVEVLFVGADRGEVAPGRVVAFERSLPLEVARHPDTLLAWEMNGEPLTVEHGAPLRLVVPRWYAVASVKWLTHVRLLERPFEGHFQTEKYVYERERGTPEKTPVRSMRVRSVIARPAEGAVVPRGVTEIAGTAWSGDARVERVEVSVDGGKTWREAALGRAVSEHAWVPWKLSWNFATPGSCLLMSRATDASGRSQPLQSSWNAQGYGNNVVHQVQVEIL